MSKVHVLPTEYTAEYETLAHIVMEMRADMVRAEKGNKIASKRTRSMLRKIRKFCMELIRESHANVKSNSK